jgi:hypothetical protein
LKSWTRCPTLERLLGYQTVLPLPSYSRGILVI